MVDIETLPKFPDAGKNTMPIQEQFAMHMHRKRKIQHLSQHELAFIVGSSQTHIANIESGRGNPSASLMQRIATALELECIIYIRPRT